MIHPDRLFEEMARLHDYSDMLGPDRSWALDPLDGLNRRRFPLRPIAYRTSKKKQKHARISGPERDKRTKHRKTAAKSRRKNRR